MWLTELVPQHSEKKMQANCFQMQQKTLYAEVNIKDYNATVYIC